MVKLLLVMRAGARACRRDHRSGKCSSVPTGNADGSSSKRTGLTEPRATTIASARPWGHAPRGYPVAPTFVGNHVEEYQRLKIQGPRSLPESVSGLRWPPVLQERHVRVHPEGVRGREREPPSGGLLGASATRMRFA